MHSLTFITFAVSEKIATKMFSTCPSSRSYTLIIRQDRYFSRESKSDIPCFTSIQFGSVQSFDRLGSQGDMRAEILFQSFLQEAFVSSSDVDRDVHSLMLSIHRFLCRPRRRPPSKVP